MTMPLQFCEIVSQLFGKNQKTLSDYSDISALFSKKGSLFICHTISFRRNKPRSGMYFASEKNAIASKAQTKPKNAPTYTST